MSTQKNTESPHATHSSTGEKTEVDGLRNYPEETSIDPQTGKTISKKTAFLMGSGALLAGSAVGAFAMNGIDADQPKDSQQAGMEDAAGSEGNAGSSEENATQEWDLHTAPVCPDEVVSDEMSFDQAFAAAREEMGAGAVFAWQGEYYGTFYATEVDANGQPTVEYDTVPHHDLPPIADESAPDPEAAQSSEQSAQSDNSVEQSGQMASGQGQETVPPVEEETQTPTADMENATGSEESPGQEWDPHTAPVCPDGVVNDEMSLDEAFAAARDEMGAGAVFAWEGEYYNTFYATEVDANGQPTIEYETVPHHDLPPIADGSEVAQAEESNADQSADEMPSGQGQEETGNPSAQAEASEEQTANADSPQVIGLDENQDGNPDMVFVDVNHDGSADYMQVDANQDGQISADEIAQLNPEGQAAETITGEHGTGEMGADVNQDGVEDVVIYDADGDGMADAVGADHNENASIEEGEVAIIDPEAVQQTPPSSSSTEEPSSIAGTDGNTSTEASNGQEIVYEGEVAADVPPDVPPEQLDAYEDDIASLDDDFDDQGQWA